MVNRLRFIPTSEEIPAVRQLLDQHLIELESHSRELTAMNDRLRKENGKMRALLELIDKKSSSMDLCPVCSGDSDDCEPSCEGRRLAKILEY